MTSCSQRILVFLDIDGVLLPFPDTTESTCGALFPDYCLAALSTILSAFDDDNNGVELILSSTWRAQSHLIGQIIDSFHCYGKVHGGPLANIQSFSDMTDPTFHSVRQHEIYRYLNDEKNQKSNPAVAWVALDDEELLEGRENKQYRPVFERHVVKTGSRSGIAARDAQMAIELLKSQLLGR